MKEQDDSTLAIAPAQRYKLIWGGALVGIGFCFVDVMVLNEGTVRDQLLHPSAPELWMRLSFIACSTGFGIYAFTLLRRERIARVLEQEAEKRLNVLFNSAAEFIFLVDPEGTILRANQCVFTTTGYRSDEVIGRIDPAAAGSLLKPYKTSGEDGMGLGLSISRPIVDAHNGRLWAGEQRKKGALFCLSIPVLD